MGRIRHSTTVITWNGENKRFEDFIEEIKEQKLVTYFSSKVSDFVHGPVQGVNSMYTVAILPDGSKEGWEESDAMDRIHERVIKKAMELINYPQILSVNWGGDEPTVNADYITAPEDE